ncbi:MAG TPA: hypothetical protein VG937_11350 [Polyangiaceae bacterium]|nr:hypothetical protein [Polyangiaceae bacterium]
MRNTSAFALALSFCTALSANARALGCDEIPNVNGSGSKPPVVYVEGANAVGPLIAPLQQVLSTDPNPITVVYIGDGGCLGADNFFNNRPIPAKPKPVYYAGQVQATCDLPAAGKVADLATSDVYGDGCGTLPGGQLPSNIGDFLGPVQPMTFVVPKASTQLAISQAAAYFVFGFGDGSGVAPWTVNSSIYRRNTASAVQAFLALGIGVPIDRWAGIDAATLPANVNAGLTGAAAVINALELDPNPEQAIGILANTNVDAAVATHLRILAYKDQDQSCAYYPDSTPTAHDKANVRDGHYTLWGPVHFFTYVDERGVARDPNVGRLLSYILGTAIAPGGIDMVEVDAKNNLVPPCAMRVTRSVEMGPLSSYAPPGSCGCYYDYVATGASSCQRCAQRGDCPASAPVCNLSHAVGFCETQ